MPAKPQENKVERVQFRIDAQSKRMLERAAALSNMTVSGFVVSSALSEAARVITERERLILSARDWEIFAKALAKPAAPTAALRAAWALHERLTVSE